MLLLGITWSYLSVSLKSHRLKISETILALDFYCKQKCKTIGMDLVLLFSAELVGWCVVRLPTFSFKRLLLQNY